MSIALLTTDPLENRMGAVVSTANPAELRRHLGSMIATVTSGRGTGATGDPLTQVRTTRAQLADALAAAHDHPVSGDPALTRASEKRDVAASEQRQQAAAVDVIGQLDERIAELVEQGRREKLDNEVRVRIGDVGVGDARHVSGGETYTRSPGSPSWFRDRLAASQGDNGAAERLARNGAEQRALGNTGAVLGSGGDFAPPAWLIKEYVALARPGRITADLCTKLDVPPGVSSVNLPRVLTGTAVAVQTTQNTALPNADITTGSVSTHFATFGGQQVVSQQLLDQSGGEVDMVILADLAAEMGRQVGSAVINGDGTSGRLNGLLAVPGANTVAYTSTAPTAMGVYKILAQAQAQVVSTRFAAPNAVVMTPARWAWIASYEDSTGRPLVSPVDGTGQNVVGTSLAATGKVGRILGMNVYTDPSLPSNLGAGANQDPILVGKFDDVFLYESPPSFETFREPFSGSLGVLFRCFEYVGLIASRYPASLCIVGGTGLVSPVFT